MIYLNNDLFIAQGSRRKCYQHPEDPNICIKIELEDKIRCENRRESRYINKWSDLDLIPISPPIRWIETNLGRGLAFQLIRDYSGEISKGIISYYNQSTINHQVLNNDLNIFKEKILKMPIPVRDLALSNVVYQRLTPNTGRFIIIDGIGKPTFITIKSHTRKKLLESFNNHFPDFT
ncbi:YrbL family protein [Phocoenobacter skyensis]|uniref:PhoP regulatory network protein YrbL n=1 Tax=Phocoenobacter skyensis TaxID=97481 RepID=A0A1H7XT22_9PAST|nr:YrbL family protein [Pasteurella skyensis]MDP8170453.1 YrbL family protein [Pasteurella skyensis]MDP8175744.1 YrbL family protein [Pasteurella skyensis]MDP8184469.1 YrbL family protein [Pasteurella skyensis]QLB23265.1 hypothetical protein A6B44_08635 [Pasteurella skyensis]SEM36277.1 PhoP regulatory network protein YrbL [Pasteurella skyensis]